MKYKLLILFLAFSFVFQHVAVGQISKKDKKEARKIIARGDKLFAEEIPNYSAILNIYLDAIKLVPEDAELNFRIGVCYFHTINQTRAIKYFQKAIKIDYDVNPEMGFLLGKAYQWNMEFDKAIREFRKYRASLKLKELEKKYVLLMIASKITETRIEERAEYVLIRNLDKIIAKRIKECEIAKKLIKNPVDVIIMNIGLAINSPYPEYAPVISADESVMYFTSRRKGTVGGERDPFDGQFFEDVYVSYNIEGKWSKAKNLGTNINTKDHDAPIGLSADGQTLFTYSYENRGDINISKLKGENWARPKNLDKRINTSQYTENSIALSGDERTLMFVSTKPGGFGGRDIYKSVKDAKGRWTEPVNIGPVINTEYDEDGVFLHPDGKTFYFSSKGHNNMGGYDVFKSTYENDKWTKPVNIGYPVNTVYDDLYYVLSASGERGYYTSVREDGFGEKDIYTITWPKPMEITIKPEPVNPLTLLKGIITDAFTKNPLEASIQVVDNEKNKVIAEFNSNSFSGKYLVTLPSGKNYGIAVQKEAYMFHSENFDIPTLSDYQEIIKDIALQKIAVGTKIVLKNIFYDFDKATLRKESLSELERLVDFLNKSPEIKVEISGHTDNKGSADYNQKLSERRAQSVVKYLIDHGITKERLKAVGYGEESPIADNQYSDGKDNPEGRQQNRRTEFEILEN